MGVRITDPVHGHHVLFHAPAASSSHAAEVTWGPRSIHVPSHSPLNGTADVWFNLDLPDLRPRASAWCVRAGAQFLGLCHTGRGFGFRVAHFSRFKFSDDDSDDDNNNNNGANNQRPPTANSSSTTLPIDDDVPARTIQAGSTPARPRVSALKDGQRHAAAPAPADRPRLSIRAIADLDDTDPDLHDMHPDSVEAVFRPPGGKPNQAELFNDPHQHDLMHRQDDVDITGHSTGRNHRKIIFDDEALQGQWGEHQDVDAPSVHKLRDALFTPSLSYQMKAEPMLMANDIDMADAASQSLVPGGLVTKLKSEAPITMYDDDDDSDDVRLSEKEQQALTRSAEEKVWANIKIRLDGDDDDDEYDDGEEGDRDDVEILPLASTINVLPFLPMEDSVVRGKLGVVNDAKLMFGRTKSVSFYSPKSEILSTSFHPAFGFSVLTGSLHGTLDSLPENSYKRLLASHCFTWFGSLVKQAADGGSSLDTNAMAADKFGRTNVVRMPTLNHAFVNGDSADFVLGGMVDTLKSMHDVFNDANALHASIVFGLLAALYKSEDPTAEPVESGHPSHGLVHRLTKWIGHIAGNAFDDDEVDDVHGLRKVVIALAVGDVSRAIDITIELGHYRLAMLVSRALEFPKDALRRDAEAQLRMYGLGVEDEDEPNDSNMEGSPMNASNNNNNNKSNEKEESDQDSTKWDRLLIMCEEEANVSIDERMILLILSGHVSSVSRYLKFSWYRLFALELLYGRGSNNDTEYEWERVLRAVMAVERCEAASTSAPHGETDDVDIAFQLLRLYTENGDKVQLLRQLYCNSSFGVTHQALDYRFSWLLYQTLAAIIPEAALSPRFASAHLADGLYAQLKALDLPLWAFYAQAASNGSVAALKTVLLRDWAELRNDSITVTLDGPSCEALGLTPDASNNDPELISAVDDEHARYHAVSLSANDFLTSVLRVPNAWLCEARAVAAHHDGKTAEECDLWLQCGTGRALARCHDLVLTELVPRALVRRTAADLQLVSSLLQRLEAQQHRKKKHASSTTTTTTTTTESDLTAARATMNASSSTAAAAPLPDWATGGGLVLLYLRHVAGVPHLLDCGMPTIRAMVRRCAAAASMSHAARAVIADGVLTAQRALLMRVPIPLAEHWLTTVIADLETAPCSKGVRIRLTAEYITAATLGWSDAHRVAAAFPPYRRFVDRLGDRALDEDDKAVIARKQREADERRQQEQQQENEDTDMEKNEEDEDEEEDEEDVDAAGIAADPSVGGGVPHPVEDFYDVSVPA